MYKTQIALYFIYLAITKKHIISKNIYLDFENVHMLIIIKYCN